MKHLNLSLLLLITGFTALTSVATTNPAVDKVMTHFAGNDKVMGSLAVYKGGDLLHLDHYGYAHVNDTLDWPITDSSLFRVGSISKTFTATLVFKLAEDGLLDLNTRINRYFPNLPNAESISILQLMRHESGIFSLTDDTSYMDFMSLRMSKEKLLQIISDFPPAFKPGEKTEYSNSNYLLLTWILEQASGLDYAVLLKKYITGPLELHHTFYGRPDSAHLGKEVASYGREGKFWVEGTITDVSVPLGAGAIISTASDIALFYRHLAKGDILNASSLKTMTEFKDGYGAGIFKIPFYEKMALGHSGGIDQFVSNAAYFEEDDISIALLTNGLDYPMNDLLIQILSAIFQKEMELPDLKKVEVATDVLNQYAGTYVAEGFPLEIIIRSANGTLYGQATGQPEFPLSSVADNTFTFDAAGLKLIFESAEGRSYMTLLQMGNKVVFSKK
jgi:D-alanyl-D-alanine carboxypeptidase